MTLFFEYIPRLLSNKLNESEKAGDLSSRSLHTVHDDLLAATTFMNAGGLHHFDTHFGNILADGTDIYLTDLGLATSASFDLSPDELEFLEVNKTHDVAYVTTRLLNWIVTNLGGITEFQARNETILRIAVGEPARSILSDHRTALVEQFAPVASLINSFYEQLHGENRNTPYPAAAVEIAWASATK